jgi:cellulose synthase/poly-beta-1,6-N-acetylglucosamine synthase-like glycosyltransferase
MASTIAVWALWLSVAWLVYAYGGFAAVIAAAGWMRRQTVRSAPITPRVTLVIAAYNEEECIAARIENALAMEYVPEHLQILVASDGSTDATNAIVSQYSHHNVTLLALPRAGKIHALNAAVGEAAGEILVFSDANTMCEPGALNALVRNFADPRVGGVAGHTMYALEGRAESSAHGENLYWNYDTWLKRLETQSGSVVSAHGGLYAIRRSLYRPVADLAVTDDFAISTAVIEQGYRLVFEPEARATEFAVPEARREFRRRVRLMTRGLRGVVLRRQLLNPLRYGFYSVVLFSHKVVRRLAPGALVVILAASMVLASSHPFYLALLVAQVAFYSLAFAGYLLRQRRVGRSKAVYVPFFYCMANLASAIAVFELVRGTRIELWQPQRHPGTR